MSMHIRLSDKPAHLVPRFEPMWRPLFVNDVLAQIAVQCMHG